MKTARLKRWLVYAGIAVGVPLGLALLVGFIEGGTGIRQRTYSELGWAYVGMAVTLFVGMVYPYYTLLRRYQTAKTDPTQIEAGDTIVVDGRLRGDEAIQMPMSETEVALLGWETRLTGSVTDDTDRDGDDSNSDYADGSGYEHAIEKLVVETEIGRTSLEFDLPTAEASTGGIIFASGISIPYRLALLLRLDRAAIADGTAVLCPRSAESEALITNAEKYDAGNLPVSVQQFADETRADQDTVQTAFACPSGESATDDINCVVHEIGVLSEGRVTVLGSAVVEEFGQMGIDILDELTVIMIGSKETFYRWIRDGLVVSGYVAGWLLLYGLAAI